MYKYLFTNDLRISVLELSLKEAGTAFVEDAVPSASEDKSANNNMNTLGFYFNLTNKTNCAKIAQHGDSRTIVLNFIKKFQFPNPRTFESYTNTHECGIQLCPMRLILKLLFLMVLSEGSEAYLTKDEIKYFIFYNSLTTSTPNPDILSLYGMIKTYRSTEQFPSEIELDEAKKEWKQEDRQLREMIKVLTWSGCVHENGDNITIKYDSLTESDKANIFDIVNCSDFWESKYPYSAEEKAKIKSSYQSYMDIQEVTIIDTETEKEIDDQISSFTYNKARNRIIFGAPGTGKSFLINNERKALLNDGGEYERVTFHPDYSYAQFVGTYKPTMVENIKSTNQTEDEKYISNILCDKSKTAQEKYDLLFDLFSTCKERGVTRLPILVNLSNDDSFHTRKVGGDDAASDNSTERSHGKALRPFVNLISGDEKSSEISYEYIPGPFMRTLVKSLKSPQQPYLLIIEEINRANVAAVFGDVFQLLDRDDDENSEYPIQTTEDMRKYLAKELGGTPSEYSKIRIPSNMFIWATMNSADQGVFPMDTAFKRRWDFTYIGVNKNDEAIANKIVQIGTGDYLRTVKWNELRKGINNALLELKINEDKLLGPYFLSKKVLGDGDIIDPMKFADAFKNKVIMYLFEDVLRQKGKSIFTGCGSNKLYSSICDEFDEKGIFIFGDEFGAICIQTQQGDKT